MIALRKICILSVFFLLLGHVMTGQGPSLSERKKEGDLKKIERKNDCYVKKQEKKIKQVLFRLSKEEKSLYKEMDSTKWESALVKTSFSVLEYHFSQASYKEPEVLLAELSNPVFKSKTIL